MSMVIFSLALIREHPSIPDRCETGDFLILEENGRRVPEDEKND